MRPVWKRNIAKKPFLDGGADFWFQYVVRRPDVADSNELFASLSDKQKTDVCQMISEIEDEAYAMGYDDAKAGRANDS